MSHLSGINKGDIKAFRTSCLGSGPIKDTIHKLMDNDYTDLDIWNLYIWELDKYVHVESISGVPYRKIRDIGKNERNGTISRDFHIVCSLKDLSSTMRDFAVDVAKIILDKKVFKFVYYQGHYCLGTPFSKIVLEASNAFIEYYNSHKEIRNKYSKDYIRTYRCMIKYNMYNGMLYPADSHDTPIEFINGREMFTFKGKPVVMSLKDFHTTYTYSEVYIINIAVLSFIVYTILKHVNIKYGRTKDNIAEKARIL